MDNIIVKWAGKLITGLKLAAGSIVGRAMTALGLTWVNFTVVLPEVKAWLTDRLDGLSSQALQYISAFKIDVAMVLILSAIVARIGMKMLVTTTAAVENLVGNEAGT